MFTPLKTAVGSKSRKATLRAVVIGALLLSTLSGCAWFQFPGVYRLNIQQGNIITQEMVDKLQLGMTKRQVNFVLGTPLVQDSFNLDRWDYYYSLSNSNDQFVHRKFTTYFDNDALVRVEGDYHLDGPPVPPLEESPLPDPEQGTTPLDETLSNRHTDIDNGPVPL